MRKNQSIMPILDAMDILTELREWQYLLDCLDKTFDDAYCGANSETRAMLTKMTTVLRAYDNEKVIEKLTVALEALEYARKQAI